MHARILPDLPCYAFATPMKPMTRPAPRRAIARAFPTRGDLACGGRFVELEYGHLVVIADLRAKTHACGHCAGVQAATILLDDYFRRAR